MRPEKENTKLRKLVQRLGLSSAVFDSAGFTLIELLVVLAILAILAGIGLSTFRTSQMKSRDARRKSDLEQVQRALEAYMNDHNVYPYSTSDGEIVVGSPLVWDNRVEFKDDEKGTVYMKQMPQDPTGNPPYCYKTVPSPTPATSYQLYAKLENTEDPKCTRPDCTPDRDCGGNSYNYGVSSSNTTP